MLNIIRRYIQNETIYIEQLKKSENCMVDRVVQGKGEGKIILFFLEC